MSYQCVSEKPHAGRGAPGARGPRGPQEARGPRARRAAGMGEGQTRAPRPSRAALATLYTSSPYKNTATFRYDTGGLQKR